MILIKNQRFWRMIINDVGEYLSATETETSGESERENRMAEAARAMRSIMKSETSRNTSDGFLRATHINIGIVFPNLEDDIPLLHRNPTLPLPSQSLSLSLSPLFSLFFLLGFLLCYWWALPEYLFESQSVQNILRIVSHGSIRAFSASATIPAGCRRCWCRTITIF